jgi:hypothetical protein
MDQASTVIDQAVEEGLSLSKESAIQAIITQELPAGYISKRKGRGGKEFTYIKHGRVVQILNEAFLFKWSFDALPETLRDLADGGKGIFGRLTVYIDGEEITKTECGTKDFVKGMLEGDYIKSAISDSLRRCAMRLGVALDLYLVDEVLTSSQVMTQLCVFAKNKAQWAPEQVRAFLKGKDYTAETLVAMQNDAYRDLAEEIAKPKMETLEKPEDTTSPIAGMSEEPAPEPDPVIEEAEKLGAEVTTTSPTGQKVNFMALYAYSEEHFKFTSAETKAILLIEMGQEWYYGEKKLMIEALEKAKAQDVG